MEYPVYLQLLRVFVWQDSEHLLTCVMVFLTARCYQLHTRWDTCINEFHAATGSRVVSYSHPVCYGMSDALIIRHFTTHRYYMPRPFNRHGTHARKDVNLGSCSFNYWRFRTMSVSCTLKWNFPVYLLCAPMCFRSDLMSCDSWVHIARL